MIGGQAVIEGVLMRSDVRWAMAVRTPTGEIVRERGTVAPTRFASIPGLRGVVALGASLRLGSRALRRSLELASGGEVRVDRRSFRRSFATALTIVIAGFVVFPGIVGSATSDGLGADLVESAVRLALVFGYLIGIGSLAPVRRVLEYHGAEHQAVAAFEAGDPLTVESARQRSRFHVRCGTTFIVVVAVLSGFAHPLLESGLGLHPVASRVIGLPVVLGLAFELLRWVADRPRLGVVGHALVASQRMTTRCPDDAQLEVALDALRAVLEDESSEHRPGRGASDGRGEASLSVGGSCVRAG